MKIILINNVFTPQPRSGAERLVQNLSKRLIELGHEVKIFSTDDYEKNAKRTYWQRLFFHVYGFFNLKKYFEYKKFLAMEAPDLVWSHNLVGFGLIILLALRKYKLLYSFHDIQLLHPSGLLIYKQEKILNGVVARLYQFFCKLFFPKQAVCLFPSQWLKDLYIKHGFVFKNSLVIENPLRKYKKLELSKDSVFTFLFLGQLEKHKGIDLLIKAFLSLSNKGCRLLVAGNGSLELELKKNNKDPRINFLGIVNNPEEIIAQSDCVVVPSLCYENLPTTILEAFSQKVPVIASALGGIQELVTDKRFLFLPEENEIKNKLEWCLVNQIELKKSFDNLSAKTLSVDDYLLAVGSSINITF